MGFGCLAVFILAADYADYADSGCDWLCVPSVCRWIMEVLGVVCCAARRGFIFGAARVLFGLVRISAGGCLGVYFFGHRLHRLHGFGPIGRGVGAICG